jgi:hypothetical protein
VLKSYSYSDKVSQSPGVVVTLSLSSFADSVQLSLLTARLTPLLPSIQFHEIFDTEGKIPDWVAPLFELKLF